MKSTRTTPLHILIFLSIIHHITGMEDSYLRYVKDSCFINGEALSCVKYKALKIAKNTIFGDNLYTNETIKAGSLISFVPLDEELVRNMTNREERNLLDNEPKSFLSEWTELAKYMLRLVKEFFRVKGLKVNLPDGARAIEEDTDDDAFFNFKVVKGPNPSPPPISTTPSRGRKKKLALVVPLLTLLAALKAKLLLLPILLAVLFIKKLLLIAAFLLPNLLHTLKHCKHHSSPHYSYFGASDSSNYDADSYAYSSGSGGYVKDWASNRAYNPARHRPTPAPVYITAPGAAA